MPKGKKNDELVYFCSGIPVTRARAQEIRSSPRRTEPLQMPASPILLRSGKILRSPKPSRVDPKQDPVCQILNQIMSKHRKTPPPEEEALDFQLQQILKPLSARTKTPRPGKTESSIFEVTGSPPGKPGQKPTGPPRSRTRSPGAKLLLNRASPKLLVSTHPQPTRSARIIHACGMLLADVIARVESAIGVSPRRKTPNIIPKTPIKPGREAKEYKLPKSVTVIRKPTKYVDRGTSPIEVIDLTPPKICEEPIGDPGFRFQSVGNKNLHSPVVEPYPKIKTEPFTETSPLRLPLRTRSFRPQISPSNSIALRRRVISVPCSIL